MDFPISLLAMFIGVVFVFVFVFRGELPVDAVM